MSEEKAEPVHLSVRKSDGVVSVRLLLETPVGLALVDGDEYVRIGQVLPIDKPQGKDKFRWHHDEAEWGGATGTAGTHAAALKALLAHAGYRESQPNETNQGLF